MCLMEDILDLYAESYRENCPVICFDEFPYQLISEVRKSVPAKKGQPERYDYEYRREGTCNIFICVQPLAGWRYVKVTKRRTKQDFAHVMKDLVEIYFKDADRIRIVFDNLNTHTPTSFYETFRPEEARGLTRRLEFHYTPKHSSWLNMAEVEISVINEQCLDRRLGSMGLLKKEINAWQKERNASKATIDWSFTVNTARDKLKRLYPEVS